MNAFYEIPHPQQMKKDMGYMQNNQSTPHPLQHEHWHDVYEILYVRRGWGQIKLNTQVFAFHPGDIVLICPGDMHSNGYSSPDGCDIDVIQFTPAILYHHQQLVQRLHSTVFHTDDLRLEPLLNLLSGEDDPGRDHLLSGIIHLITGILLSREDTSSSPPVSALIQEICAYLETADDLRLAAVAAHFGYTPEHLSRLFHKETGLPYRQWCTRLRMNRAAALLRQSSMDLSEIAQSLGFSDASSFIRAFRQTYGITPSAYRRGRLMLLAP